MNKDLSFTLYGACCGKLRCVVCGVQRHAIRPEYDYGVVAERQDDARHHSSRRQGLYGYSPG